jgi:prepilin-type processing-associated H-X9-DG protein/prepilin-type N-terminal cleavage/methylation domain-containing protein
MPSRGRAFTLVELLVVVGVIAVLIAIAMPALNRAREQANRVKCAANLRSIGQGMAMYTQRYGTYPGCFAAYSTNTTYTFIWPVRLRPFLGGDQRVFLCPSRDDRFEWTESAPGPVVRAAGVYVHLGYERDERLITWETYFSYGCNAWGTTSDGGLGNAVEQRHIVMAGYRPELKASRVKSAAEMIAVADSTGDAKYDAVISPLSAATWMVPGSVHGGGANVLFCDGHVSWYPQKDLILPEDPLDPAYSGIAQMWNYDHTDGLRYTSKAP